MKEFIKKYYKPAIFTVLFFFMIFYMIKSTEQAAGILRELYYSRGALFFTVLIFILRKVNLKRPEVWGTLALGLIAIVGYCYFKNIRPSTYGIDGFRVVVYRYFYIAIALALLIEVIVRWKRNGVSKNWNIPMLVILGAGMLLAAIFDKSTLIPLAYVVFALLFTDIDRDEWLCLVDYLVIGYFAAFACMMLLSLTVHFDNRQDGRLIGAFLNVGSAGIFCGGGFVCALYFLAKYIYNKEKKIFKLVISLVLIAFSLVSLVLISSRSALFGIFITVLGMFVFMHGKKEKGVTLRRGLIAVGIGVLVIVTVIVGSIVLYNMFIKGNDEFNPADNTHFYSYLLNRIYLVTSLKDSPDLQFDSTILNVINIFTSARLEAYMYSIDQIRFYGHEFESVEILGGLLTTPHNFYIYALVAYGWIGGGCIIIWIVMYLVSSLKKFSHGDKAVLMPGLWIMYCVAMFMSTCGVWASPVFFAMLFLQYPLLRKQ